MVDATELIITSSYKNLLMLTILENHEGKTIEMVTHFFFLISYVTIRILRVRM